jgi:hypothetical protein
MYVVRMSAMAMPTKNPSGDAIAAGVLTSQRSPTGIIAPRLELDHFCQDTYMFNLYLLALEALQLNTTANLKSPWSWFGLGRIHGGVTAPWDGVKEDALSKALKDTGRGGQFREWIQPDTGGKQATLNYNVTTGVSEKRPGVVGGYCTHGSVLL